MNLPNSKEMTHRWVTWAREIQALAQIGETFAENRWQSERYSRLMEIAAEITSAHTEVDENSLL